MSLPNAPDTYQVRPDPGSLQEGWLSIKTRIKVPETVFSK